MHAEQRWAILLRPAAALAGAGTHEPDLTTMGIYDRDYMRSDRSPKRGPGRPPRPRRYWLSHPMVVVVTACVLIVIGILLSPREDRRGSTDAGGVGFPDYVQPLIEVGRPQVVFPVDLNTATIDELDEVPWIGPPTARLIEARRPFQSVEELLEIRGITESKLEDISKFVTVEVVEPDDADEEPDAP